MNEILQQLLANGALTDKDSEEIKELVKTFDGIGSLVLMFSETQGTKDLIGSVGNLIGELYRNLTSVQKIPKDVAAQIIVGIRQLPVKATAKKS